MRNQFPRAFAMAAADQMISDGFHHTYGASTFAEYLDHIDSCSTAHLAPHLADGVKGTAGQQRRKSVIRFDHDGSLVIGLPMKDPRTGETRYATTDFLIWIDLMEIGANGAWYYNYKGSNQSAGQVRCSVPLKGGGIGPDRAAVVRIIANAKSGQQARLLDHDPFNLRQANINLLNHIESAEGCKCRAKTDTRMAILQVADTRSAMAGMNYDYDREDNL